MTKVQVTAKPDHIKSLSSARPVDALAELIWNGFDSGSNKVVVTTTQNAMGALSTIKVRDSGAGINFNKIESLFGGLGDSWKKLQGKQNGRALHGKNGKGRFKAFGLGQFVEWTSVFAEEGKKYKFKLTGNAASLDGFEVTEAPALVGGNTETGTEVTIENLDHDFRSLKNVDDAVMALAKIFAAYLTEYPDLTLEYQGEKIDPANVQESRDDYDLGAVVISQGRTVPVKLTIVEWKIKTDRTVHLCDANGISLHEISPGTKIRAPGFDFTAYVKTEGFRTLDHEGALALAEMHEDVTAILKVVYKRLSDHFREKAAQRQSQVVEEWIKEEIYPYANKERLDPIEAAERQVFDIVAVNVQSYLPAFEDSNQQSKKFTFKLAFPQISRQIMMSKLRWRNANGTDEIRPRIQG